MNPANFTFIDLFAGIGGFHQALSHLGGKCVLASDWNEKVRQTYQTNYGITPLGDIQNITSDQIPNYDVLCGGFPC
ncbi:Modification methylase HpaII [Candidatus Nitrosacidococcus sp. I8]|nr:Modification methylase HpaII [Candidatus Nitrosacidococcus sp. I8]